MTLPLSVEYILKLPHTGVHGLRHLSVSITRGGVKKLQGHGLLFRRMRLHSVNVSITGGKG